MTNSKKLLTGQIQDQNSLKSTWRSSKKGKDLQTKNNIGSELYDNDKNSRSLLDNPVNVYDENENKNKSIMPEDINAYIQPDIENDNLMLDDINVYEQPNIENDNLMSDYEDVYTQPDIENDNLMVDDSDVYVQPNIENDNLMVDDIDVYTQPNIENDNLMVDDIDVYTQPNIENDNLMTDDIDVYVQPTLTEPTMIGDTEVYVQPNINHNTPDDMIVYNQPGLTELIMIGENMYEQPDISHDKPVDSDVYIQPNIKNRKLEDRNVDEGVVYIQPDISHTKPKNEVVYEQPSISELIDLEIKDLGDAYNEQTKMAIRRRLEQVYSKKENVDRKIGIIESKDEIEDVNVYSENTINAINRKMENEKVYDKNHKKTKETKLNHIPQPIYQKKNTGFDLGNIYDELPSLNATEKLEKQEADNSSEIEAKIKEITKKRQHGNL